MASVTLFLRLVRALPDTSEAPHFDRLAFRRATIFATLAADRLSANLKLTSEQQNMKCLTAPDVFAAVPGGWGAQGWTTMTFKPATRADLEAGLRLAWEKAAPRAPAKRARQSKLARR